METNITKKIFFSGLYFVTILFFSSIASAQDSKSVEQTAFVEKVSGVPIFLFSEPISPYKVVGKAEQNMEILLMDVSVYTSVTQKAKNMVKEARERQEKGKLGFFNAIYVDLELSRSQAILFPADVSLKAKAYTFKGISVFFFSKPFNSYDEVAHLPSKSQDYEENGFLTDKVNTMIKRALRHVKAGEQKPFDGIIFNPDDLSAIAIKFK